MSTQTAPMLRLLRYSSIFLLELRYGKRKRGAIGAPLAFETIEIALSICCLAVSNLVARRFLCDQVWVPMVWPAAATARTVSGSASAIWPTMKNVALVHWSESAFRIAV